ncbi:MAG: hypothetical protein ABIR16_07205 [Dokdonella sp.]
MLDFSPCEECVETWVLDLLEGSRAETTTATLKYVRHGALVPDLGVSVASAGKIKTADRGPPFSAEAHAIRSEPFRSGRLRDEPQAHHALQEMFECVQRILKASAMHAVGLIAALPGAVSQ